MTRKGEMLCRECDKPLPEKHIIVPRPVKAGPFVPPPLEWEPKPGEVLVDRYCPECWEPYRAALSAVDAERGAG
jgi:hypothetical protein